jgi:Derlin-2/3
MNARGLEDTGGPQAWYDSLPIITRNWLTLAAGTTIMTNFEIIPIMKLYWSFDDVSKSFEIWRLITPFLYLGKFKFETVISMFLLYQYSNQYEGGVVFNTGGGGGTADYAYMLALGVLVILVTGSILGLGVFFGTNLIFYVLYVWSKRNPTAQAAIWGIPMKGMMLPFALLALKTLMGNPVTDMIHGMVVGHIYYFMVDVVPKVYGKEFIRTPLFLIQKFGIGEYVPPAPRAGMGAAGGNTFRPGGVNPPRDPAAATATGGHSWGNGGQRLGRE